MSTSQHLSRECQNYINGVIQNMRETHTDHPSSGEVQWAWLYCDMIDISKLSP